jgi:hypothetical protein
MRIKIPRSLRLSCEHTAQLISLGRDHKIGIWRRAQIRVHNAMCETCRSFAQFVNGIGGRLKQAEVAAKISPLVKERIKLNLRKISTQSD